MKMKWIAPSRLYSIASRIKPSRKAVKAASDIYAPISGEVLERNVKVIESPELVNSAPYGDGWMLKVRLADKGELTKLLNAADYRSHIGESAGIGGD